MRSRSAANEATIAPSIRVSTPARSAPYSEAAQAFVEQPSALDSFIVCVDRFGILLEPGGTFRFAERRDLAAKREADAPAALFRFGAGDLWRLSQTAQPSQARPCARRGRLRRCGAG